MPCYNCDKCLNAQPCDCNCITTTTTCIPVAEQPCIKFCDDLFDTACVIYDGEDNECYGVYKGDTIKEILTKIIYSIIEEDCTCQYDNATIELITTTTTQS